MRVIIDGYNLLFAWGWVKNKAHPRSLMLGRQKLLEKMAYQILPANRKSTIVIFDAKSFFQNNSSANETSNDNSWGFDVRFATSYDEADTMIEVLISQESNPKKLSVVSSDQRLISAVRRRGGRAIKSLDWFDQIDATFRGESLDPDSNPSTAGQHVSDQHHQDADDVLKDELKAIDWLAEFGVDKKSLFDLDENMLLDLTELSADSPPEDDNDFFNPFPPGYGEDLL